MSQPFLKEKGLICTGGLQFFQNRLISKLRFVWSVLKTPSESQLCSSARLNWNLFVWKDYSVLFVPQSMSFHLFNGTFLETRTILFSTFISLIKGILPFFYDSNLNNCWQSTPNEPWVGTSNLNQKLIWLFFFRWHLELDPLQASQAKSYGDLTKFNWAICRHFFLKRIFCIGETGIVLCEVQGNAGNTVLFHLSL